MASKRLEVELLVCPACFHIGKRNLGEGFYKGFCTGPARASHKKTKMELRRFVEASA